MGYVEIFAARFSRIKQRRRLERPPFFLCESGIIEGYVEKRLETFIFALTLILCFHAKHTRNYRDIYPVRHRQL